MTSIGEKAEHVRAALRGGQTGGHTCHWPGCEKPVPPAAWGCPEHWYTLPHYLRRKIWDAYDPGQEQTKTPTRGYVDVALEVQDWIAMHELMK